MIRSSINPGAIADAETPLVSDDGLTFRRVKTLQEYHECVTIQEETWGVNFRERVPSAILLVGQKLGGVCAAAFAPGGRMLGFVFGMTGTYKGEPAHWSDLLAVRQEARDRHVGERLKRYQRQLCRAQGVNTIYWTFDPLVARNAHLNLKLLGARASEYVVNMYGSNTGSPLHGTLETDRWVAAWDLAPSNDSRVVPSPIDGGVFVVRPSSDGPAPITNAFADAAVIRVAVPKEFGALPHEDRVAWRDATRGAFLHYLGLGYQVVSFHRATLEQPPFYELSADTPHR
ncbi:MAG: hypothetical protein H7Z40_02980 [Phycisphaerae bacterium]|nr:hypothetical protein [Gemmatimonadaceae bacterium]